MVETQVMKKVIWFHYFLSEIDLFSDDDTVIIHADNCDAMNLARNSEFHICMKHINIQYHFVHKAVNCGLINFKFVSMSEQAANKLIKFLSVIKFRHFLTQSDLFFVFSLWFLFHSHFLILLSLISFTSSSLSCCWTYFLVESKNFILTSKWVSRLFRTSRLTRTEKKC